jgi:hypothetical protein
MNLRPESAESPIMSLQRHAENTIPTCEFLIFKCLNIVTATRLDRSQNF